MLIWRTLSAANIVSCLKSLVSKPEETSSAGAATKSEAVAAGAEPR